MPKKVLFSMRSKLGYLTRWAYEFDFTPMVLNLFINIKMIRFCFRARYLNVNDKVVFTF